jgi:hypothetical protein
VALLARTAGLLGQLAEEMRNPIAPAIYYAVDRNAVYRPAEPSSPTPSPTRGGAANQSDRKLGENTQNEG